jgi:uncharacterized protein
MSEREVENIIKTFVSLLNVSGIHIEKVFLYGSYARGEATNESDIDVMLISNLFESGDPEIKAMVWGLTRKVDIRIEPYMVSMKRYISDEVSPLLQIVRNEGKEIIA